MQSMLPPSPHEDTHLMANSKTPMRYAHIDVLKGGGILLVVLLHSFPPAPVAVNDIPPSLLDPHSFAHKVFGWLGWVVPGAFACSGLLYAKDTTLAAASNEVGERPGCKPDLVNCLELRGHPLRPDLATTGQGLGLALWSAVAVD
mmetsp:Transcript_33604/g.85530  ORF Transcript_33604/g.85530 Transcript_33604/m.85530 type:complete len:145 (+) Transcript_33604:71-505(+)